MIALRYVYVLALSVWFGGIVVIWGVAGPASDAVVRRFFLMSYAAGAVLLASLLGMALLGPRPSGFAGRLGVVIAMCGLTMYSGLALQTFSTGPMALVGLGGLALLFWEARDGTRAA